MKIVSEASSSIDTILTLKRLVKPSSLFIGRRKDQFKAQKTAKEHAQDRMDQSEAKRKSAREDQVNQKRNTVDLEF